jgi:hypothetical protein
MKSRRVMHARAARVPRASDRIANQKARSALRKIAETIEREADGSRVCMNWKNAP